MLKNGNRMMFGSAMDNQAGQEERQEEPRGKPAGTVRRTPGPSSQKDGQEDKRASQEEQQKDRKGRQETTAKAEEHAEG